MDGKFIQPISLNMSNLDLLIMRYPHLECCKGNIIIAFEFIRDCYKNGGKLLVCGNGEVLLMLNILWGS